jgi:Bacterial virulence factor lipase N-terminal
MKRLFAAVVIIAAAFAAGCSSSVDNPPDVGPTDPTMGNGNPPSSGALSPDRALFAPNQGVLPYPHDAYFTPTPGVPTDGTLNLPSSAFFPATVRIPGTTTTEPVVNALDGFSTQAPIKLRFSSPVDITTAAAGIRLVEVHVDPATKATVGFPVTSSPVRRVLTQDVDYRAEIAPNIDAGGALVQLVPIRPLLANNDAPGATRPRDIGYMVLVTNSLRATNGNAFAADANYATIKSAALTNTCATITDARLNALCGLARAHFGAAAVAGVDPTTVIVSSSFTTQSVDTVLRVISGTVAASPPPATLVLPVPVATTGAITGPAGPNLANLHVATITLPYYLSTPVAPPTGTGTEPLTNFWRAANPPPAAAGLQDPKNERNLTRFNPFPAVTTQLTVPMLIGIPRAPAVKPAAGWPVVIYQHGITEDRATLALIADATAAAGFIIVGIDLPLHGIMPSDPLYALSPTNPANAALPAPFRVGEPTFGVDYINNTTLAAGPDGVPDPSGQHFINLTSTLTSRDNIRQAVANLIALTRAVPTLDLDGNPATDDIDESNIRFFGWSLGGIVGSAYAGTPGAAPIKAVALFAAGCGVMETLRQSPGYSPILNNGLAAAGIPTGSSIYYEFVHAAQAAVEAGDGCNYAANWAAKPTLLQMIQGTPGVATKPSDRAVPNSSTLRLAELLGVPTITTTTVNPAGVHGLTRFTEGGHGTIALPASSSGLETLASYVEARTELASFLGSGGLQISVANSAILAPQ